MLTGTYSDLYCKLIKKIDKKRIFHDPLYTLAYGTDASFYRLIPKMVIKAAGEEEVSVILKECSGLRIPVTFRAAGTSLSGQAITDSVLVIAGEQWKRYNIDSENNTITLQPGLTGGVVNRLLSTYGRKIGPDPASLESAMIGGIAANNASGMCCGTSENTYKTINNIRIILSDGTLLDTGNPSSREAFRKSHERLLSEIADLSGAARSNTVLAEKIRKKYKMKNTTGYSLNALVDFSDPFDIIEHLMVGSEGTLGFIAGITLKTVIEHHNRASSLMIFPDLEKACLAVPLLKASPVSAVELIDRAGLRSVEEEQGVPSYLRTLHDRACALLVETVAATKEELHSNIQLITKAVDNIPKELPVSFTDVRKEYELLWKIRKGLFPSVGAVRKTGTTVIIEDVAFPIPVLAEATATLQELLKKYRYDEAVIFGHALEGNLHFVFSQDFSSPEEVERYKNLIRDVSDLVIKHEGSLKAEHGTGRNMAPFVELEWGKDAYALMKKIKHIFDPLNILNPGVILNDDQEIHLKNFKPIPEADEIIDKCTECGFCEISCVSAGLTLTPRQRIVLFREISSLVRSGHEPHLAASLLRSYSYSGDETCATDGLCATACPVKIDTGKLIKKLRLENIGENQRMASWIARNMSFITAMARSGLSIVSFIHAVLGTAMMKGIAGGLRKISGNTIPAWNSYMPGGAKKITEVRGQDHQQLKVVYFPSCINRAMGTSKDHREEVQLTEKMMQLLRKGGYEVIFPEGMNNLCCGMAFLSKGYKKSGEQKSQELESALLKASNDGEYPVLCDMSPCLFTMKDNFKSGIRLYEPVEFITKFLLPRLDITPLNETVTIFPVCSMKKMGLDGMLADLAACCASGVVVPDTNCCGFAGDRGFTYPELNRYGLRNLRSQIPENVKHGYSTSRTCEIGLSMHSGVSHKSIVYLVDKVSSPKKEIAT
jgi:D-lactate dehydrogenase